MDANEGIGTLADEVQLYPISVRLAAGRMYRIGPHPLMIPHTNHRRAASPILQTFPFVGEVPCFLLGALSQKTVKFGKDILRPRNEWHRYPVQRARLDFQYASAIATTVKLGPEANRTREEPDRHGFCGDREIGFPLDPVDRVAAVAASAVEDKQR